MVRSPRSVSSTATCLMAILFVSSLCSDSARAGVITWNVTYADVINSTGVGFDDPTEGALRRGTITAVYTYLNTILDASGVIDLEINQSQTDGTGFLATAGPYFFTSSGFSNGFAYDHATTGNDPAGAFPDAQATFDFGYTWNSGTDAVAGGEYDLYSVALHEIVHALGILSTIQSDGTSSLNNNNPGRYTVFESLLARGDGTLLFGAGGNFVGTTTDLTSGDVFFTGANATAANGGNPVPVYAPSTFESGSSIAHFDDGVNSTMTHSISAGTQNRTLSAIDLGTLQDIGWTLQSSVPEPGQFLALAAAGVFVAFHLRRRHLRVHG